MAEKKSLTVLQKHSSREAKNILDGFPLLNLDNKTHTKYVNQIKIFGFKLIAKISEFDVESNIT